MLQVYLYYYNSFARAMSKKKHKVLEDERAFFCDGCAKNGISNEIYTLANDTEIRPTANIVVCKNTARDYIQSSEPILENLIT